MFYKQSWGPFWPVESSVVTGAGKRPGEAPGPRAPELPHKCLVFRTAPEGDLRPGMSPTLRWIVWVVDLGIFDFLKLRY